MYSKWRHVNEWWWRCAWSGERVGSGFINGGTGELSVVLKCTSVRGGRRAVERSVSLSALSASVFQHIWIFFFTSHLMLCLALIVVNDSDALWLENATEASQTDLTGAAVRVYPVLTLTPSADRTNSSTDEQRGTVSVTLSGSPPHGLTLRLGSLIPLSVSREKGGRNRPTQRGSWEGLGCRRQNRAWRHVTPTQSRRRR